MARKLLALLSLLASAEIVTVTIDSAMTLSWDFSSLEAASANFNLSVSDM